MNTANGIYPSHQNPLNSSLDQNGGHAPFGQHFNGANVNPNNFDFASQFSNQPGPRFGDGLTNNTSPSIHQSPFQVPSVIPQKRTREEQVSASPHPPQTTLGQSRSQTPQQAAFNQYGAQPAGPNFSTPTPFQQHMHASNHATPSPNPSNQQFRPPTSQPSMSSPQNFPGQHPQAYSQMQNQMNRMGTPQNANNHFMPGMQPGQGFHPGAHGGMGPGGAQMPGRMPNMQNAMQGQNVNPQQQEMFKKYQENILRQQQMRGMGQMPQGGQPNGMTPPQRGAMGGSLNPNMPGQPGMPQGGDRSAAQHQAMQFMQQLHAFLHARGQQLDPNPTVCGRKLHYFHLFQLFIKLKPHQSPQGWALMLHQLQIPPQHQGQAVQELKTLYDRNLAAFGQHYIQMLERQRHLQQGRVPGQGSPPNEQTPRPPVPPGLPGQAANAQIPSAGSPAMKHRARAPSTVAPDGLDIGTPGKAGSVAGPPHSPQQFANGSPVPLKINAEDETKEKPKMDGTDRNKLNVEAEEPRTLFDPEYKPRRYSLDTHGGLPLDLVADTGAAIHAAKTLQRQEELGPIDLQAVTMSLQSGIPEEITYSLDRLAMLSHGPLVLTECSDLIDSLLDLARDQLQVLGGFENAADLQILSIDELTSCCRDENLDFQDQLSLESHEYKTRHAVDYLLAITTILRNLSFPNSERHNADRGNEANRKMLITPDIQSLLSKIIWLLHTPTSPIKSYHDRLDIVKDVVVFMSNVSESLVISSDDDARTFLAFLLAFAPKPSTVKGRGKLSFATFEPLKHQHLPNALDSLAKLMARDDPNRGMIKTILHNDFSSKAGASDMLLTKAFALAIAPVPEKAFNAPGHQNPLRLVDRRKPSISQGMLVLDILSTLIPGPSATPSGAVGNIYPCLQRQWLESDDGWASRVVHLVVQMSMHDAHTAQVERHPVTQEPVSSGHAFTSISQRALSMLRRLLEAADKADIEAGTDQNDLVSAKLLGVLPLTDLTISAMLQARFDVEVVRGLTALAQMIS